MLSISVKIFRKTLTVFFFWWGGKMAESFKDVVHDSPSMGLGVTVKTKNFLCRTNSHIYWVTPFLDAKLNALVVTVNQPHP